MSEYYVLHDLLITKLQTKRTVNRLPTIRTVASENIAMVISVQQKHGNTMQAWTVQAHKIIIQTNSPIMSMPKNWNQHKQHECLLPSLVVSASKKHGRVIVAGSQVAMTYAIYPFNDATHRNTILSIIFLSAKWKTKKYITSDYVSW